MSKVSSANYPNYSSSSVSLGGSTASTGVQNGILTSDYDMSGDESDIYNYALSTLANILPQLNTFDSNTQSSINSEVDAYKNSGLNTINQAYNSSLKNIENDAVSRFGNLDNSAFVDNLNNVESERSKAVSSFAQDTLAKQSQLESDELTKRYTLAEFLSGIANNTYDNALSAISTAQGSSSSANSYNNDLYNAISSLKSTGSNSNTSDISSLLSNLLGNTSNSVSNILSFL
jgi:hypothetical protein